MNGAHNSSVKFLTDVLKTTAGLLWFCCCCCCLWLFLQFTHETNSCTDANKAPRLNFVLLLCMQLSVISIPNLWSYFHSHGTLLMLLSPLTDPQSPTLCLVSHLNSAWAPTNTHILSSMLSTYFLTFLLELFTSIFTSDADFLFFFLFFCFASLVSVFAVPADQSNHM